MKKSQYTMNAKVRVSPYAKYRAGYYGQAVRITSSGKTVTVGFYDGVNFDYPIEQLILVDRGGGTPIESYVKRMSRRTIVCLVENLNSHHLMISRKNLIELINNPHTRRVTAQFKNMNIAIMCDKEEGFNAALELLDHKRDYIWTVIGE